MQDKQRDSYFLIQYACMYLARDALTLRSFYHNPFLRPVGDLENRYTHWSGDIRTSGSLDLETHWLRAQRIQKEVYTAVSAVVNEYEKQCVHKGWGKERGTPIDAGSILASYLKEQAHKVCNYSVGYTDWQEKDYENTRELARKIRRKTNAILQYIDEQVDY